ncbi:MAG: peptidoglycan DD-metalloendopeptidase family protein [Vicingaceae bacterium]|nr:peptidoglycan DD-metalloendopeptidase family protein [Vicingaceae bacterium]
MKNFIILIACLGYTFSLLSQTFGEHGGGINNEPHSICLTPQDRLQIKADLAKNIKILQDQGKLKVDKKKPIPQFIWPVVQASGFNYERVWYISNHVDHNAAFPNQLSDYNCGTKTYDTPGGYNHKGIDIGLWPFYWNQFDDGQADIVAAADGTIITKYDGNFDQSCSLNSNQWNAVYLQHADGSKSWYGHMKNGSLTTKGIGSTVIAGEYLGKVGSSGNSTGPHLHFEVYDNNNNLIDPFTGTCNTLNSVTWWLNPLPYLNPNINTTMTHFTAPQFTACPNLSITNDTNFFMSGDTVFVAAYFADQISGTTANLAVYDPANNLHSSWTKNFTNNYTISYWYWWFTNITTPGQWRFEVSYQNQTVDHYFTVGNTTGLSMNSTNNIKILNNPFNDKLNISGNLPENATLIIYNITGKEVFRSELTPEIQINKILDSGNYIVKVTSKNNQILLTQKLIKL